MYIKPRKVNSKAGFTLMEVLVVAGILGVLLFPTIFATYRQGLNMMESARDYTRVTQILQSEIEAMRSLNWEDIKNMPSYASFTPNGNFVQAYADKYSCYKWVLSYNSNTDQRIVYLICSWNDSKGKYRFEIYSTIFTEGGLNDYYYRSFDTPS